MQKFDASKNEYLFRDKYYGRSLDDEGFYQELRAFLNNGVCFRSDLVPSLLSMVQQLRRVIERQGSYRFYSSSLLIIYDGAVTPEMTLNKERSWGGVTGGRGDPGLIKLNEAVRLNEDGEGVQHKEGGSSERNGRMDEIENGAPSFALAEDKGESASSHRVPGVWTFESSDLLHVNPTAPFRRQHHLECSQNHQTHNTPLPETTLTNPTPPPNSSDRHKRDTCCCHEHHKPHPSPPCREEAKLLTCVAPTLNHKNGYHHSRHHAHQRSEMHHISKADLEMARKSVDLRMIDFAHSTHSGYNDHVVYSGPDEGYVLGVSSLVACFERMLSEST